MRLVLIRVIVLVVLLLFFNGCHDSSDSYESDTVVFETSDVLDEYSRVLDGEFGVFYGGFAGDYLLFEQDNPELGGGLYHVYDASDLSFLGSVGKRGRGPGEFYGALTSGQYYVSEGETIAWVNDAPQFKISAVNFTKSLEKGQIVIEEVIKHDPKHDFMNVLFVLEDSMLAGYQPGFHPSANEQPLHFLRDGVMRHYGSYPEVKNIDNLKKKFNMAPLIAIVNRSKLVMKPSQDRFAVAMEYYDKLDVFDSEGNIVATVVPPGGYEEYNADDLWDSQGKGTGAEREYYQDLVATDSYIYGFMANDKVRVFDWDGDPVIELAFPFDVGRPYMVDEERGWLYANDMTNEGIVRFSLNPLISN